MDELTTALLDARAAGDDAAVDAAAWALVQAHEGWIRSIARRRSAGMRWRHAYAEDWISELTLRAHAAMRTWEPEQASAVAWLARCLDRPRLVHEMTDVAEGRRRGATSHARARGYRTVEALHLDAACADDARTLEARFGVDDPDVAGVLTRSAQARAAVAALGGLGLDGAGLVVRTLGLDGCPPESLREIARRRGVTAQGLSRQYRRAVDALAHPCVLRRVVRGLPGS